MLGWVVGGVGTFVVSLITACLFLHVRCRKIGRPFGPRARPWAIFIVTGTALLSTALGLVILAASQQPPAAYLGILVPGGLWIAGVTPRDRQAWIPLRRGCAIRCSDTPRQGISASTPPTTCRAWPCGWRPRR